MVILLERRSRIYSFTWTRIIPKMWGKAWLSGQMLGTGEWVGTSASFSLLPCPSEKTWSFYSLPFLSFHSPYVHVYPLSYFIGKSPPILSLDIDWVTIYLGNNFCTSWLLLCFSTHYSSEMYVIPEQLDTWPWGWVFGGFVWRRSNVVLIMVDALHSKKKIYGVHVPQTWLNISSFNKHGY